MRKITAKAIALLIALTPAVFARQKGNLTDPLDNKTYKTVKIGTQTWMAENLNIETGNSKCYGNKYDNCKKYGRLYDWKTAMKACPSGWHLPSKAEWQTLVNLAGGDNAAGKMLKASNGWNGYCDDDDCEVAKSGNGTDKFGFSALSGGLGSPSGSFGYDDNYVGNNGNWWTASEENSDRAYFLNMHYNNENVLYFSTVKGYFLSVRCIKD